MPRPKSENPKTEVIQLRVCREELEVYKYVSERVGRSVQSLIREQMAIYCSQFKGVILHDK